MKSMKSLALITMALAMGGMSMYDDRHKPDLSEPATDAQRRMFTHPVKLNKKQKALRKQRKQA